MSVNKDNNLAYLNSEGEYTSFQFQDRMIRFLTGNNLERYTKIIEWDHGYLVVTCKTKSNPDIEEEDYIDLLPILDNLYIDPDTFLDPINKVEVHCD